MTKSIAKQFSQYESLRLELAELARRFDQAAQQFPGVYFSILQADHRMESGEWSEWIDSNRTDVDACECFDVYPLGWQSDDSEFRHLKKWKGQTSEYCGLYRSKLGNLQAATTELGHLAECGTKILYALKEESESHTRYSEFANVSGLCPGSHGWLDAVRNTAELHKSGYISCKYTIYGVEDDVVSHVDAMGCQLAEAKMALERGLPPSIGVGATEITPDIFTASANAIRLWLQGEMSEQIERRVYEFEPIRLAGAARPDVALTVVGVNAGFVGTHKISPRKKKKKSAGAKGPSPERAAAEQKLLRRWESCRLRGITISEFARAQGRGEREVRRILDRARKRNERAAHMATG